MPDNEVYGFDASTTARIADTVRGFEELFGRPPPRSFAREYSDTAAVAVVRVTSTTLTNGENPGRLQKVDPHTTPPTFSDLNTYDDSWVIGPNGETLTTQLYGCVMDGDGNSPVRPRWIVLGGLGGGSSGPTASVVLRVPTAGSGLVSAFVQTWTDGAPPSRADGASAYVFDPNGNAINNQFYTGTYAVTHSDGNKIYAVMSGFTGQESICLGDGQYHTFTWAGGDLVSIV